MIEYISNNNTKVDKKLLFVVGTRPEAIKLSPLILEAKKTPNVQLIICLTGQHTSMAEEVLKIFDIKENYNLNIMKKNQCLSYITQKILVMISNIFLKEKPDFVIVQGDTTSAFAASLAAFYLKIPVVHVEAGLRTNNKLSPYPEEMNRLLISKIATLHMCPTQEAVNNLRIESIKENVFLTGNTIVDAVHIALEQRFTPPILNKSLKLFKLSVLITIHRRENLGEPLSDICKHIKELANSNKDIEFIWVLHPNPAIQEIVKNNLFGIKNICLSKNLPYVQFIQLIKKVSLIISDSGGIQEEAGILGKKILIARGETERKEIIKSGYGTLIDFSKESIEGEILNFIQEAHRQPKKIMVDKTIFGKRGLSKKILQIILSHKIIK